MGRRSADAASTAPHNLPASSRAGFPNSVYCTTPLTWTRNVFQERGAQPRLPPSLESPRQHYLQTAGQPSVTKTEGHWQLVHYAVNKAFIEGWRGKNTSRGNKESMVCIGCVRLLHAFGASAATALAHATASHLAHFATSAGSSTASCWTRHRLVCRSWPAQRSVCLLDLSAVSLLQKLC